MGVQAAGAEGSPGDEVGPAAERDPVDERQSERVREVEDPEQRGARPGVDERAAGEQARLQLVHAPCGAALSSPLRSS